MPATQSYKTITLETYFTALITLEIRLDQISERISDKQKYGDSEGAEYWRKEMAKVTAAIAELRAE